MLNQAQTDIIKTTAGGLLVIAPVGTGKTLALAERAGHAVSTGIDPDRILCLTFTNRAAKEMSERIKRKHPKYAKQMTISTFHALCANMLRFESREIGIPSDLYVTSYYISLQSGFSIPRSRRRRGIEKLRMGDRFVTRVNMPVIKAGSPSGSIIHPNSRTVWFSMTEFTRRGYYVKY